MSEQAVDLRSSLAILRRNRAVLAGAAALGLAAGMAFVLMHPAKFTSTSLVLLPPPVQNSSGQTTSRGVDTEVRIAHSDVVLGPAGKAVKPQLSADALAPLVQVKAPTTEVIQIKASYPTPLMAQQLSQAVANSYVTYVKEAASSLSAAQQAALNDRLTALQGSLSSVQSEVEKTTARAKNEDPLSASGKADATALAQLTAQQASLALQIDQVKEEAAAGQQPLNSQSGAAASVLQHASPAVRPVLAERLAIFGVMGLLAAVLLAAVLLMTLGRRDRKLRSRDEIADALGSAVIASVRSRVPKGVSGWASLLEGYSPGTVDAWALRQALRQLVLGDAALGPRQDRGLASGHQMSITVISLAEDRRGLAVGAQLASFAAASGIRTRLVGGQRHESAAALWTACSSVGSEDEVRPGLVVDTHGQRQSDAELTVVLVVVDRRKPELISLPDTTVTVLAVSSGSATAEDLARTAVTADDAGSRIDGILVADPDKLDRTTGRLSHQERLQQVVLPTRLTGVSTPSDTLPANVTGLRRGLP